MKIQTMLAITLLTVSGPATAQSASRVSEQLLYLPVYARLWHGEVGADGNPVRTTVSIVVAIRNTNTVRPIQLLSARYVDSGGKPIREYVATPVTIAPLAAYEISVERNDDPTGSGAGFHLNWTADRPVNAPIVEGVHGSMQAGRPGAFVTTARPVLAD